MSADSIRINFSQAKAQANSISEIAENMRTLAERDFNDTIQQIASAWQGDSASAYLAKAELVRSSILSTAKALADVASEIRAEAKRIYDAEMRALEIAQHRMSAGGGYGGGGRSGHGF